MKTREGMAVVMPLAVRGRERQVVSTAVMMGWGRRDARAAAAVRAVAVAVT
jgi:hypothetical protein